MRALSGLLQQQRLNSVSQQSCITSASGTSSSSSIAGAACRQPRAPLAPSAAPRASTHSTTSTSTTKTTTTAGAAAKDNPDLDEIVLDDSYYAEIGMTREQAMRQQQEVLYSVDPEATPLGLDSLSTLNPDVLPDDLRRAVESIEVYGPQALILAGFRAEEYAVIRATLDTLGAHQVKVLPASDDMLYNSVDDALSQPEIDWAAPRPPEWIRGGAWGSQRTVLFSGLSIKAQATLLELLEAQGLPQLCVTMATKDDASRRLGEVMAEAVKAQRGYRPTPIAPWEMNRGGPGGSNSNSNTSTSTNGSTAATSTPATQQKQSSSSSKSTSVPWTPGKRGRLFAKRSGGSSGGGGSSGAVIGGEDGLESLKDLIPPEVARARLKLGPNVGATPSSSSFPQPPQSAQAPAAGGASAQAQQQEQQQQQQQQQPVEDDDPPATRLPEADSPDAALLDWFNNELGGPTLELPWTDAAAAAADGAGSGSNGSNAAAAAAAAAMGFEAATGEEPWEFGGQQRPGAAAAAAVSLDDLFAGATGVGGDAAAPPSDYRSSGSSMFEQLLPDTPRPSSAAAAAAGATPSAANSSSPYSQQPASWQQQQRDRLTTDQGLEFPVDLQNPDDIESTSVLSVIQSALKSGVSAEELKQLIDAAAAEGAAATDEVDLLLNADAGGSTGRSASPPPAAGGGSKTAGGPNTQQSPSAAAAAATTQQQQQQRGPYGPQPPPPPGSSNTGSSSSSRGVDGLLSLRPEVQAAFANNQVKFVDLSRLPKKYRQQYNLDALKQQRAQQQQAQLAKQQQQEEEEDVAAAAGDGGRNGQQQQRWWQQQSKRQQLAQSLPGQVLGRIPPGGKVIKMDVGDSNTAAAAASGVAAGGSGDSSSSSRVQSMYDVTAGNYGAATGAVWGSDSNSLGGFGGSAPGSGQYDAELEDMSAAAAAEGNSGMQAAAAFEQQQIAEEVVEEEGGSYSDDADVDDGSDTELVLDESKLQQLVDSAQAEGLDVSRALAEALAFGVSISPEAAAAVGVQLPDPEVVESARQDIVASIHAMQEEQQQQQEVAAASAEQLQREEEEREQQRMPGAGSSRGAGGGGRRSWGAGLKARRPQSQSK